jgi:RIO-like serine/threonine protein kinase
MLIVVYSGSNPHRISSLLDSHHAGGYTEFRNAHGAGTTGRREGSRAWPGESTLFFSVIPADRSVELVETLREEGARLPTGERVHVAVLPTETFF